MQSDKLTDEWVQRQHQKFQKWNQKRIARAEASERFNFRCRMFLWGVFLLGFAAIAIFGIYWLIELYRNNPTLWSAAIAPLKNHTAEFGICFGFIIVLFIILFPLA